MTINSFTYTTEVRAALTAKSPLTIHELCQTIIGLPSYSVSGPMMNGMRNTLETLRKEGVIEFNYHAGWELAKP